LAYKNFFRSRKKKLLWQLGTIIGAPVGIALIACISIPAMIIGIPSWVGRKIHDHYKNANKHKRNLAVVGGVVSSLVLSPALVSVAKLACYENISALQFCQKNIIW
jgi:E3 ubiquitin-protein ligase RNF19A